MLHLENLSKKRRSARLAHLAEIKPHKKRKILELEVLAPSPKRTRRVDFSRYVHCRKHCHACIFGQIHNNYSALGHIWFPQKQICQLVQKYTHELCLFQITPNESDVYVARCGQPTLKLRFPYPLSVRWFRLKKKKHWTFAFYDQYSLAFEKNSSNVYCSLNEPHDKYIPIFDSLRKIWRRIPRGMSKSIRQKELLWAARGWLLLSRKEALAKHIQGDGTFIGELLTNPSHLMDCILRIVIGWL